MTLEFLAFHVFAIACLAGGLFTVLSHHLRSCVLWLCLSYLAGVGLLVLLGMSFMTVLVFVLASGGLALLLLLTIERLDTETDDLKPRLPRFTGLGAVIGLVVLMQVGIATLSWTTSGRVTVLPSLEEAVETATTLGFSGNLPFILIILLAFFVAFVAVSALIFQERSEVRRKKPFGDLFRDPALPKELHDVRPGQGS